MLMSAATGAAQESFLTLCCEGAQSVAVYSPAKSPRPKVGVVIVVGGPQYRVGSHRQFVHLARILAHAGVPALRFDYRGMGDSDGDPRTFESIDDDIASAVDALVRVSGASQIVLWGLCDGASAALIYAARDKRIVGIVAANPWARTPEGEARTRLKHYYLARIVSRDFWSKVFAHRIDLARGTADLLGAIRAARREPSPQCGTGYLQRMSAGWRRFDGHVLFLMSGQDYTAREFEGWVAADPDLDRIWRGARAELHRFEDADHTFSSSAWRDAVAQVTLRWIDRIMRPAGP
jgi:exosortase A-associated hydrolase 1